MRAAICWFCRSSDKASSSVRGGMMWDGVCCDRPSTDSGRTHLLFSMPA